MNKKELVDFILQIPSETRAIEFKRLGSRNEVIDKTLQTIIAMANTDGGTIILGVDDPEKTTKMGLDRIYGIEENLELFDELGHSVKKLMEKKFASDSCIFQRLLIIFVVLKTMFIFAKKKAIKC